MGKPVSIRTFAKIRGVSHTAVQKAIKDGRITARKVDGKTQIDPDVANPQWDAATDPAKSRAEPTALHSVASRVYADSRAAKESYAAKTAKLDYEHRAGQLAEVSKVSLGAFQAARIVRDFLSGMSARISGKLAAESDPVKVQIILDAEINRALQDLARVGREKTGVTEPAPGPEAAPDAG